jgi:hypothetical protein
VISTIIRVITVFLSGFLWLLVPATILLGSWQGSAATSSSTLDLTGWFFVLTVALMFGLAGWLVWKKGILLADRLDGLEG